MKTLGLIGGMSWESTQLYYRAINQGVAERLGGLHSAQLVLWSVDFASIAKLQAESRWDEAGAAMADAARRVETAGAQTIVLCTNTMHKLAETIEAAVKIPLLHIADATATRLLRAKVTRVGLLGTRFTMEQDFYRNRLARHGISVVVPNEADRALVHRVIYDELCRGNVRDASREAYREVIGRLAAAGAEAVLLGCTEITMLVGRDDSPLPLFDTTAIHAQAAVEFALG
jgi:aspartate racemase